MISMFNIIIEDPNISEKHKEKELDYKKYVDYHISNVSNAWDAMKDNNMIIDFICAESQTSRSILIPTLDALILSHDRSKYGADEWEQYRRYYYPVDDIEKQASEAEYERAAAHHYACNLHHPEHWKDNLGKMPMTYIVEMCCDWIAVSMGQSSNALDWYHENAEKKEFNFNDTQKEWIEFILKEYYR